MTIANKIFSGFSFIGFVLCCIPFRRHMRAWNIGICLSLIWTGIACLMYFVDSIVWNDNYNITAPVWCDITSHLHLFFTIAIPMDVLIINYRVYYMTLGRAASTSNERRRGMIFDLAVGIGIPALVDILLYIPQNGRFLILEDFGCYPCAATTFVSIILFNVPQMLIVLGCVVYSVLTVRLVYKRYSELNKLLASNGNVIDRGFYTRIVIVAVSGSVILLPMGIYAFVLDGENITPWPGIEETHADISVIYQIPADVWKSSTVSHAMLEISRWEFVFTACFMFIVIGLPSGSFKTYLATARRVFRYILRRPVKITPTNVDNPKGLQPDKGLLPLAFTRPASRKLKFLDFSANKTRVIADIDGGLPQTRNSAFSSITTHLSGNYRTGNITLTSHHESAVASTASEI